MADATALRSRIEKLKATRASGVLTVEYPERGRVTYRSIAELDRAIAAEEAELAGIEGRRARRSIVIRSSKGW